MHAAEQSKDRLFWLKWLEKYKYLRCLWDVDSKEYTNRAKRKDAYVELVAMAKRIHPDADEGFVKARINCFRTAYRKEAKKVLAARENGGCYEPTWFYYNQLNSVFLLDNNLDEIFANQSVDPSDSSDSEDPFAIMEIKPNIDRNEYSYGSRTQERPRNNITDSKVENSQDFDDSSLASFEQTVSASHRAIRPNKRKFPSLKAMAAKFNTIETNHEHNGSTFEQRDSPITPKASQLHYNEPPKKRISSIGSVRASSNDDSHTEAKFMPKFDQNLEEECDIIGRRVASHFKNMKPTQRLIAERIICDVCIHGRMDQLTWETSFMTADSDRQTDHQMNGLSDSRSRTNENEVVIDPDDYT